MSSATPLLAVACVVLVLGCSRTAIGFGHPSGAGADAPAPVAASNGPPPAAGDACGERAARGAAGALVVQFVIDGSGSMCEPFDETTRWSALRSSLLDASTGVIVRLQDQVAFGVRIYSGSIDPFLVLTQTAQGSSCGSASWEVDELECPVLVEVEPALGNADAITAAYPSRELGGSTPTDKVLGSLVDELLGRAPASDTLLVLATDGQPNDICVGGQGGDGATQQQNVIAAVDRAAAAGVKTAVVSLAGDDPALRAHLDEVAARGDPLAVEARAIAPTSLDELAQSIGGIVEEAADCPRAGR